MARTALPVDMVLLKQTFDDLDGLGEIATYSDLFDKVALFYNESVVGMKPISSSVVRLRVLESGWEIKTQKGKRGRSTGFSPSVTGQPVNRVKKSERFQANPEIQDAFANQRAATPERFVPLLVLAQGGSRSAAVKLNCLECSGWRTNDVRACSVNACHMFAYRPYQGKAGAAELESDQVREAA